MTLNEIDKQFLDKWAEEALSILKKYGYLDKSYNILKAVGYITIGIFFTIVFLYAINIDAFKSNINQTVTCPQAPDCNCPAVNISIPSCPTPYITCNNNCTLPTNYTIKINST